MFKFRIVVLLLLMLTPLTVWAEEDDLFLLPGPQVQSPLPSAPAQADSQGGPSEDRAQQDAGLLGAQLPEADPLDADPRDEVIITISATGDVTIGSDKRKKANIFDDELKKQGGDLSFCFRNVYDLLSQDEMTIVNFEGTLTDSRPATDNSFSFAAPPAYVDVLTLGSVEAVSLDNNHVFDHGQAGYADTQQALASAGIVYSGNGESGIFEAMGVKIGMLSYRTFDGRYPTIYEAMPGQIQALRDAGCQIVIVSYHWGAEREYEPNDNQVKLGRATIDAGADLVLGHHSHRINPIEFYKGKYICYSLGNFSFAGNSKPDDMDTFIFQQRFRVTLDGAVENAGMRIVPCRISSQTRYNDFAPTLYGEKDAARIVEKLKKLGKNLPYAVTDYPLEWE